MRTIQRSCRPSSAALPTLEEINHSFWKRQLGTASYCPIQPTFRCNRRSHSICIIYSVGAVGEHPPSEV